MFVQDYTHTLEAENTWENVTPSKYHNYYLNRKFQGKPDTVDIDEHLFTLDTGHAQWSESAQCFFVKYKKPDPKLEISVRDLDPKLQKLWTESDGARAKEWSKLQEGGAIKVWRGNDARALRKTFHDRIVSTRWHEKWKDMGDDYNNGLSTEVLAREDITSHMGAKSRWIMQGFTDPDISLLNRTVATSTSEDLMLALQLIASIRGNAGISDVSSAFGQSI